MALPLSDPSKLNNDHGFTLIEVLVAVLIMVVGLVGLLQAVNVALEHNLRQQLRTEAVALGERHMNDLRLGGFDSLVPVPPATSISFPLLTVQSKLRGGNIRYTVERTSQVLASNFQNPPQVSSVQLEVIIRWSYRGGTNQNRVVSVVSRPRE